MTQMMQNVGEGHVKIEFTVASQGKDGAPVKEPKALDFFYDIYRNESGTYTIKYTKSLPDDPALLSKFLSNPDANKLLKRHIATNIKEKLNARGAVVIEEASGL